MVNGNPENGKETIILGAGILKVGLLTQANSGKKLGWTEITDSINVIGHNYLTALYQTRKKQSGRSTDQLFEGCLKPTQEQQNLTR